jgi:hypothetical protein
MHSISKFQGVIGNRAGSFIWPRLALIQQMFR